LQDIAIGRKMHDYQFFRAVQRWLPPLHADCGTRDVDSLSNDLRVDLCTTNTNYTDSQNNVAIGFTSDTGSGIAIGCDNFGADSVEMALVGTCN
jgi:hypothetical protein